MGTFIRDAAGKPIRNSSQPKDTSQLAQYIASAHEDRKGHLWFGSRTSDHPRYITEGVVSMYNGVSFTRYPEVRGLTANDIYNI